MTLVPPAFAAAMAASTVTLDEMRAQVRRSIQQRQKLNEFALLLELFWRRWKHGPGRNVKKVIAMICASTLEGAGPPAKLIVRETSGPNYCWGALGA